MFEGKLGLVSGVGGVAVVLVKKKEKPALWVAGTPAFWAACATEVFLMALSRNPRLDFQVHQRDPPHWIRIRREKV